MKNLLKKFNIRADVIEIKQSTNTTKYYLKLSPGATLNKLERISTEIALAFKAYSKPLIYPILNQGLVVIEIINNPILFVNFDEINLNKYNDLKIPIIIGKTQDGEDLVVDLIDAPHTLVCGSTGFGKSVLLNSMICSILKSKKNIKLVLVDPKCIEFEAYKNIKQLLYPVANSSEDTQLIIEDLIEEMNFRYKQMAKDKVSNINEYKNNKFPYIVTILDEFGDLSLNSKREFSDKICLLAQKSRACGLTLVISSQRPSVSIISGNIKNNFPMRISFKVASMTDSRVVLDCAGAERLLDKGDGLIISNKHNMVRFKGAFIDKNNINKLAFENNINLRTKILRKIRSLA